MIRKRSFNRMMLAALVAAGVTAGGNAAAQRAGFPAPPPAAQLPGYLVANETFDQLIIKFRNNGAKRSSFHKQVILDGAAASLQSTSVRRSAVHLGIGRTLALGSEIVKADVPLKRADADALVKALASHPEVEYAEVDVIARPQTSDRWWHIQWNLHAGRWGIDAPTAWVVTKGEGIVVGIVDTGINPHRDLDARRLPGYNFHERNANLRPPDACEHGDAVESIITAQHNTWGPAGIAPNAQVVPIRAIDCNGGRNSDIAEAILWAAGAPIPGVPNNANPANVINISLAAQSACQPYMQSAIDVATSRGAIVVAAAGNVPGWDVKYMTPANCNNTIAVGMINSSGQKPFNTATGAKLLWAPGNGVHYMAAWSNPHGVTTTEGTSMAAPHVAGTIALMQSRESGALTTAQAEAKLRQTGSDLPGGGRLIHAGRAVRPFAYVSLDQPVQLVMGDGFWARCVESVGTYAQPKAAECITAGNQQMWWFHPTGDGHYIILNRNTRFCLDVEGASSATGARVLDWKCHTGNNQRWAVEVVSRDDIQIRARVKNRSSGKCLAIASFAIQVPCTDANTVWSMRNTEHRMPLKEHHALYAAQGGNCITHDNNWVALKSTCTRQNMGLRLKPKDGWNDLFRIHTIDPNRCMTVESWYGTLYAAIRSCTDSLNQQWRMERDGSQWQLRNSGTDRCLATQGGSFTPGTWLVVQPCDPKHVSRRWVITHF